MENITKANLNERWYGDVDWIPVAPERIQELWLL
jgi:hypothetical protein